MGLSRRGRFVSRNTDGNEYAFKGLYHDIVPDERVIQTFEFEGMPGHVSLETLTLEEDPDLPGKTKYVAASVFQSVEDRDGMVQSGMQEGASEGMDRLAEVIQGLLCVFGVDTADAPDVIARHVADAVRRALAVESDPERRVARANQLLTLCTASDENVTGSLQQLIALIDVTQPGQGEPVCPVTPLSQAALRRTKQPGRGGKGQGTLRGI
ncbi:MAG: SRPBCC domain-containing protein [Haloechinothrix sp.]